MPGVERGKDGKPGLGGFPVKGEKPGLEGKPVGGGSTKDGSSGKSPGESGATLEQPESKEQPDDRPAEERAPIRRAGRRWHGCIRETDWNADKSDPPRPEKAAPPPRVRDVVPARLRNLPVFQEAQANLVDPQKRAHEPLAATTDNSNTQFAILALMAASRHDVPMTRTMRLVVKRFQTSQNRDGSWGYHYQLGGGAAERPAMTCVGLLGLAIGHALMEQPAQQDKVDPAILRGFVALSKHVGEAIEGNQKPNMANLYVLWSIERVAVLYDLPTIANKDWYRWAAQILVAHQQAGGNWQGGGYHGAHPIIDTCLALLVLKRVDLVRDLRANLVIDARKLEGAIAHESAPSGKENQKPDEERPITPTPPVTPAPGSVEPPGAKPDLSGGPTTAPTPATDAQTSQPRRGWPWWLLVVLAVSVVALGGGVVCVVLHLNRRKEEDEDEDEEEERPSRKARGKSRGESRPRR
jgi:hypothetical protein